jgi:hypothetical protein
VYVVTVGPAAGTATGVDGAVVVVELEVATVVLGAVVLGAVVPDGWV